MNQLSCSVFLIYFLLKDVDPRCLETEANEILTAIVHGMRRDEPSNHVKLAATNALLNSLEFTRGNFEKDAERHFIMQVVCEATQSEDVQVKHWVFFYLTLSWRRSKSNLKTKVYLLIIF
jgi:hypothetical protein